MPVLRSIRERFAAERPLDGRARRRLPARHGRDGEPRAHADRGRRARSRCAPPTRCRRRTTSPRRSCERHGAAVHAIHGEDLDAYAATSSAVVDARAADHDRRRRRPHLRAARGAPERSTAILGGTEETTTGLVRLRALEAEGSSACPVIAVNEARTERAVQRPLRHRPVDARRHPARDEHAARRAHRRRARLRLDGHAASRCARAAPARSVIVCEVDPLRALEARMEGFEVHAGARGRRARRRLHHRHRQPRRPAAPSTSSA